VRWFCALSQCCHEELIGNRGSYLEDSYFTVHVCLTNFCVGSFITASGTSGSHSSGWSSGLCWHV
jgi:hypothetical protein